MQGDSWGGGTKLGSVEERLQDAVAWPRRASSGKENVLELSLALGDTWMRGGGGEEDTPGRPAAQEEAEM